MNFITVLFVVTFVTSVWGENIGESAGRRTKRLTRHDAEDIARQAAALEGRRQNNMKYTCERGMYWSTATNECENCSSLCDEVDNAVKCSIDCPGKYAEVYLIAPLLNKLEWQETAYRALKETVAVMNQTFTEQLRQTNANIEQTHKLCVGLFAGSLVILLVICGLLLFLFCVKPNVFKRWETQVSGREDIELQQRVYGESTPLNNAENSPVQETKKPNNVPPAHSREGESYEQGPSTCHDETQPSTHI